MSGEIWYTESDTFYGPFAYAQKIITHKNYSFYNPIHHYNFDKEGGELIFIEGTFVNTFEDVDYTVPRYEYNNVMYKLNLSDPRLTIPVPFYLTTPLTHFSAASETFTANALTRNLVDNINYNSSKDTTTENCLANTVVFYAPDRSSDLASYEIYYCPQSNRLTHTPNQETGCTLRFYGLPPTANVSQLSFSTMVVLVEMMNDQNHFYYFVESLDYTITSSMTVLCYVWKAPTLDQPQFSGFWWILIAFLIAIPIVLAIYFIVVLIRRRRRARQTIEQLEVTTQEQVQT